MYEVTANMTIEIKCPSCGSTVVADEAVQEVFCTYCGTKFPVKQIPANEQQAQTLAYVRSAYANHAFAEAARCAAALPDDQLLAVYGEAARVRQAYVDYLEKAQELYGKKAGKSGLMRMLTGKNGYGDDELHHDFFTQVQADCAALVQALRAAQPDSERSAVCADVVRDILRGKSAEKDAATSWSECALEYEAAAMLPFLETDALAEIYNVYIANNAPYELLPNQLKVENAMKDELVSRGRKIRGRHGSLGERVKGLFGGKGE